MNKRYVIRKNGWLDVYLQRDNSWGSYRTADRADKIATELRGGVFP